MTPTRPFTGGHMLAIMLMFFGTVIVVNLSMAVLATSSWTGLVAKNGYVASIDYARDEAARKIADAREWSIALTAENGRVMVDARDALGRPLAVAEEASIEAMPADGAPFVLPLRREGNVLVAPETLPPGRWAITVAVGTGEETLSWRLVADVHE
ncbi:FixH family protein [Acuticoccus sp. MNP-M23]|uniref:FixH family protein n=1 Tax=Acuticoccus sp. MNP-M23 TaxID=3072793 RepID=UPI002816030D|nr:FixH family protein [Acuticoccus sp. MNP-M23]WMS44124.1 FixH family protein [Acuticoccus sp. MNP-M23]